MCNSFSFLARYLYLTKIAGRAFRISRPSFPAMLLRADSFSSQPIYLANLWYFVYLVWSFPNRLWRDPRLQPRRKWTRLYGNSGIYVLHYPSRLFLLEISVPIPAFRCKRQYRTGDANAACLRRLFCSTNLTILVRLDRQLWIGALDSAHHCVHAICRWRLFNFQLHLLLSCTCVPEVCCFCFSREWFHAVIVWCRISPFCFGYVS